MSRQISVEVEEGGFSSIEYTTGSGTYTSPPNCKYIIVEAVGGGGGGAKNSATLTPGGGGGGGGYFKKRYPPGFYNYSVGAGGLGYTSVNTNGQSGTATTFGTDSAGGGARGQLTSSGAGGTCTVTSAILTTQGGSGTIGPSDFTSSGGGSFYSKGPPIYRNSDLASTSKLNGTRGAGGAGVGDSVARAGLGGSGFIIISEYF